MFIYKIKLSMFILKILNFYNYKIELFFKIEISNCCNLYYNSIIYGRNKKKNNEYF